MTSVAHTAQEPFFHRQQTKDAIRHLAQTNDVALFVGAGVSVDQGLPTWAQLVEALIKDSAMRIPGGSPALQDDFVRHLTNKDLLSGGSIAKAVLGDELLDNVHRQLYFDEERHAQRPATGGTFAAAVAEFALTRMGSDGLCGVTIVTTNYDSLIEEAFETSPDLEALVESRNIRVVPVYDGSYEPQPFDIPVYHIHGFIPRVGPKSSDIILSERDYGDSTNIAWATDLMARVRRATGLILGASIQDPNLNRYLSTSAAKLGLPAKRYAAVALQSQPWSHEDMGLRRALLWADARRLGTLEVESIQADFFAQIPQLLKEIILARNTGISAYFSARSQTRYGVRLMRWWRAIRRTRLADGSAKSFAKAQTQANRLLMEMRETLERQLDVAANDEKLKVELWVRNPDARSLELWGSSEYISTERKHIPSRSLDPASSFASVKSFCYGSIQHVSIPVEYSRWQHFVGIPVTLTGTPWHQLQVGTVTVASTLKKDKSMLYRAEGKKLSQAYADLSKWAAEYLEPKAT